MCHPDAKFADADPFQIRMFLTQFCDVPLPKTMKFLHRFIVVVIVVAVGLIAQSALMAHLEGVHAIEPGKLLRPLSDFPAELGPWQGKDEEIEENLKYGDDHLQRVYRHARTGQPIALWMIYSHKGKDREHHPEVCMAARGLPEDPSEREKIEVPGHEKPVQKYRYGFLGEQQLVYYWYYTLPSKQGELTSVQRFYHNMRQPPASVTIEIFAPQGAELHAAPAEEFMRLVDAEMQELLPPAAVRGSFRKPVSLTRVDETETTDNE